MFLQYYRYYEEIKNRFILVFFSWILSASTCYFYKENLLFIITSLFNDYVKWDYTPHFIFTNITEIFYVYIDTILFVTNQIIIIIIIYHILMFIALGLYKIELIKLKLAFQTFLISYFFSLILLYKIVIPFSLTFFLSFQSNLSLSQLINLFFEARLAEYLEYFKNLYYICLISSQTLSVFLTVLILFDESPKKTKKLRKLFYFIFVIFSTIITPPDIFHQIIISSFFIILFEILTLLKQIKVSMATN